MKRPIFCLVLLISFAAICLFPSGCGFFGRSPNSPELSTGTPNPQPTTGASANVSFRIVPPLPPIAGVRAAGAVSATFQLSLIDTAANALQTPTTLSKVVSVDASGTAAATFSGVPLKTVVGRIFISGGTWGGVTQLHGAADLIAGDNVIDVVASGSKVEADFLVRTIDSLVASTTTYSSIGFGLVGKLKTIYSTIGLATDPVSLIQTAFISQNIPPAVEIASPSAPTLFFTGDTISVTASGTAFGGATITSVEYFRGTTKLGSATTAPFTFSWPEANLGVHLLSARIHDSEGRVKDSAGLACRVVDPPSSADPTEIDLGSGAIMLFSKINNGSFSMGQYSGNKDEQIVRTVTISRSFYMSRHEVTQTQYQQLTGENPSYFAAGKTPQLEIGGGYTDTSTLPVEQVSWVDALRFCNFLSVKMGFTPCYTNQLGSTTIASSDNGTLTCWWSANGFRLPTEAEWEFACRGGTSTNFYWGDTEEDATVKQYAWYQRNARDPYWVSPMAEKAGTQPVGTKLPNPVGLYDMHGNVWEWCWDKVGDYDPNATLDPRAPAPGFGDWDWDGANRVNRGGSWYEWVRDLRSARRNGGVPNGSKNDIGFRPIRLAP